MAVTRIELNGKQYDLQHPGARWAFDMQNKIQTGEGQKLDVLVLMDEGFDNCVFPVQGEKLTIEQFDDNLAELNVWRDLLINFILNGELAQSKKYKIISQPKKKAD